MLCTSGLFSLTRARFLAAFWAKSVIVFLSIPAFGPPIGLKGLVRRPKNKAADPVRGAAAVEYLIFFSLRWHYPDQVLRV
jgi:hypothetical protein